jgi:predicted transcriptional regulator
MQKGINMKQYPLSAGYKEEGTSKSAAELIDAGVKTIREQVFYAIINKGNYGATADEVAELLNLTPFTVRPRVTELFKLNKIKRTNTRRKNSSGLNAYVYVVSKDHLNDQLIKGASV